jgi:glycosyltransferase involved in cell wall biosynthesis
VRVLWLAKGLGPGGAERLLVHHARLGDRATFDYQAVYLVERPDSVVPQLEQVGVRCTLLGTGRGSAGWVGELRRVVKEQQIDVVHVHSPHPAVMARPVLRTLRSRPLLLYTEHSTWRSYGAPVRFGNAVSYPLDDKQFAVSADARASVPRLLRRNVEVLAHGVDLEDIRSHELSRAVTRDELGLRPGEVVVANVAHLRPIKGVDVLLEAAVRVVAEHPQVVFLSLGHGPERAALEQRHAELGLGDRFRFLGFRSDVARVLAASDIFCLSSRNEGFPLALMEASALGLPAVASRVGGLVDALSDGDAGVLVAPGEPAEFAREIGALIDDPARRARMGAAARSASSAFDARRAIRRQEQVYLELVRSSGRQPHGVG